MHCKLNLQIVWKGTGRKGGGEIPSFVPRSDSIQLSLKPVYFHAFNHKASCCSLIILYFNSFLKVLGTSYSGHHKISAKYTIKLILWLWKYFSPNCFFFSFFKEMWDKTDISTQSCLRLNHCLLIYLGLKKKSKTTSCAVDHLPWDINVL